MGPQRIQLSRKRGFSLQAASIALNGLPAVKVCRPNDFGNPYKVAPNCPPERAVALFREYCPADSPLGEMARRLLGTKNLACFCALNRPCHADWLLEIANPTTNTGGE